MSGCSSAFDVRCSGEPGDSIGQDRRLNVSIDPFLVSLIVTLLRRVRVGYNSDNLSILRVTVVSEMAMSRLDLIIEQLSIARLQTESLLDGITSQDWFRQPTEGVTHVAWQVGHLAYAEYHLLMERRRGQRPEDEELIPARFRSLFQRCSLPDPDSSKYPSPEAIRHLFDEVHRHAIEELRSLPDEHLDEPTEPAHPRFKTKFGAIQFCPLHEMLHAGQIGLLRRLLGMKPIR